MVERVAVAQNMTALTNVIVSDKFQHLAWIAKNFSQLKFSLTNKKNTGYFNESIWHNDLHRKGSTLSLSIICLENILRGYFHKIKVNAPDF